MKTRLYICLCLLLCGSITSAAVIVTPGRIFVEAALEGDALTGQAIGETLDYLTFEVTTPTSVRLVGTDLSSAVFLALAQVVENNDFDYVGEPYRLFCPGSNPPPEFTRLLGIGTYVIQVAVEEYEDGELGYGFLPVSSTEAIIATAPYSFALEGSVQGLKFLEGNRNGTFTVTQVPEPSAVALLFAATATGVITRRRQ